jgi:capsular polysaccharide export protein
MGKRTLVSVLGVCSRKLSREGAAAALLGAPLKYVAPGRNPAGVSAMVGWGRKAPALRARALAERHGLPFISVEDGFLRSFGLGLAGAPALSVVVDDVGIYFDARSPSRLEQLLEAGDFSPEVIRDAERALKLLRSDRLTKYNTGADVPPGTFAPGVPRVLVVDQTAGDASIAGGLADADSFARMLDAAVTENPGAEVWIKTHPDVLAGKREGCLGGARSHSDVRWIAEDWHPHSLLAHFDRVYVVSSQMGLDALIVGRPVTCFGVPFYSGWGLTDDRVPCERRTARRSLVELIAAAYLRYPRYLDPETGRAGDFFQVAGYIRRQKAVRARFPRRVFCVGFEFWKRRYVRPFLPADEVRFLRSVAGLARSDVNGEDVVVCWSAPSEALLEWVRKKGIPLWRMEDGFYRSVGLGSDLLRPKSLVIDERGLYFDPRGPSDLEHLLDTASFTAEELARAREVRELIVRHGLTKYNIEPREAVNWRSGGRPVLLVPGQVEDDASIVYGCESVRTNLGLLEAARAACPDAFIVFKPHPDVASGNRRGHVPEATVLRHADAVETRASVVSCLEASDAVHTMSSMAGFEALLRGKAVEVYGRPFYAGWGLTEDRLPVPRRARRLSLDELVAGALLRYPLYRDGYAPGFTSCEAVLRSLIAERDGLAASGRLERLRSGWVRRQLRKVRGLALGLRAR